MTRSPTIPQAPTESTLVHRHVRRSKTTRRFMPLEAPLDAPLETPLSSLTSRMLSPIHLFAGPSGGASLEGTRALVTGEAHLGAEEQHLGSHGRPDFQSDEDRNEWTGMAFRPGPPVLFAPPAPLTPAAAPPAPGSAAHAQAEISAMAERIVTAFSVGRIGPGGKEGHAVRMNLALGAEGRVEVELQLRGDELTVCLSPDGPSAAEAAALSETLERQLGVEVTVR